MEKFAIDLDKVLDDFEFNEDRAEQIASTASPLNHVAPLTGKINLRCVAPITYGHSTVDSGCKTSTKLTADLCSDSSTNSMCADVTFTGPPCRNDDKTSAVGGVEYSPAVAKSVKEFYAREQSTIDEAQRKESIESANFEASSTVIRDNTSRKLAQKRQNDNACLKIQHNYDKKLGQPNAKPSVSNVFSSLKEYINAPGAIVDRADDTLNKKELREERQEEATITVESSGSGDDAERVKKDRTSKCGDPEKPSSTTTTPAEYQNILLPVKLESVVANDTREGEEDIVENSASLESITGKKSEPVYTNVALLGANKRLKETKSIIDEPERVYENVYIGTDIPKTQEIASASKSRTKDIEAKVENELKHTYENVGFGEANRVVQPQEKENVYECIYIGNREKLPETTTELEITAKQMVNRLQTNHKSKELDEKRIDSTKPVFQAMQSERKPVGYSHIDDLSEEELNDYLAELEAEERARESSACYENSLAIATYRETLENVTTRSKFLKPREDEDANEAPIFESVTIGELPEVSEELLEKAKKFPIIDYSKSGASGVSNSEAACDFLEKKGLEKFQEHAKVIYEEKGRRSKRTDEKMRKTSDNAENNVESASEDDAAVIERSELNASTKESQKCEAETVEFVSADQDREMYEQRDYSEVGQVVEKNDSTSGESRTQDHLHSNKTKVKVEEGTEGSNHIRNVNVLPSDEHSENVSIGDLKLDDRQDTRNSDYVNANTSEPSKNEVSYDDNVENNEEDADRPSRPQTLDIVSAVYLDEQCTIGSPGATPGGQDRLDVEGNLDHVGDPSLEASESSSMESVMVLGKQPPFWVPDSDAPNCMLCDLKFTVLKRRHHCRACGKVLCSKCCSMKYRLEYQGNIDSRVCLPCYQLLVKAGQEIGCGDWTVDIYGNDTSDGINSPQGRQPNPNNPMEYCSTIPPLQQLTGGLPTPPTVMVPVGVLKREGSTKQRPEGQKSVIFSDGIRPGCDLTELDSSWDPKPPYQKPGTKRISTPPGPSSTFATTRKQKLPPIDPNTNSYIPQDPNMLPPTVVIHKGQINYHDVVDQGNLYKSLNNECEPPVLFAINRNLYAYVKITNLNCCVNKVCWNVTSRGLACVGQDEVILLVETLPDETQIPKDILIHINQIYVEAIKGNTITELGVSMHQGGNLLGSREHAGFLFIRQTFQCLQKIVLPPAPFLVGLLVHRWETPWAKVFPLRLVLRLGAEYRYYPCPLVSVRFRDAVYYEIGHTIMKVLADFRNFAYTLPGVRGLTIHMQDRTTDVMFPRNRYDQVIRGLNNSNDHVLAYASNFSVLADSHLVCIQTNTGDESNYQTQAINIHNKPRRVTGASFVVINGALKSSMGLSAKSSIVEDGMMVQIMPEKMEALKAALKNMQDFSIGCGRQGATEPDETVNIKWVDNDVHFNLGVKSPIDGKPMDGIPSIRVHNGIDYMGTSRFIRWTEVFILKSDDHANGVHDPVDINKLSENIARATCTALVKLLDLLATAGLTKLAVRTTVHPDNVGYEAGSEGTRLPPIYMKSLDNELIQILHKAAQTSQDTYAVLELIFHVLDD